MTEERIQATVTVDAPAEAVFDVLADPATHQAIDGTGWVRAPLDGARLTEVGQIFRVTMYHDNHPEKYYEMANRVEVIDPPHAIAWQPGQGPDERGYLMGGAEREFGGWIWRYDLEPVGTEQTRVTLTYDWSGVSPRMRDIAFPPFEPQHLDNSLKNLAGLAEQ
ncbi:Polyketide cyclase / dehydrase and lipid transport [Mycolicibacterium rhodesiae NBB3]|uniref:Polyketide cyclase / dehydrase and lipid transport n=1 Tax=Mycolicibacterium rhodesiae (strain NBB3) TaxID=710685 RepID=G8RW92_MYCRN|nr:SRPBCC family protein [Mycolicibacterium rhodesiae]AEV71833.1 Polyketide cyclase / dehydrase and lipid transport [Mycolicibacterium rhodesiae NBB3]